MLFHFRSRRCSFWPVALILIALCLQIAAAQTEDISDGESDPVKLFERGQNAHAKGDLNRALALYEAAIKLRPEFPEAEYQRGIALVSLNREAEAERPFRRAIELRKDWPLPYAALGNLLAREGHDEQAEPLLRHALDLGAKDQVTLDALATVRLRARNYDAALALAKQATEDENATASAWALRGAIERYMGNKMAAAASFDHALQIEPHSVTALKERAELRAEFGDYENAIGDLKTALSLREGDREISLRLAQFDELAGKTDEARRIYENFGLPPTAPPAQGVVNVTGTSEDVTAANNEDPKIAGSALDRLISANPKNAVLLARLGEVTRRSDPQKSAESYRRAHEIDPRNPKYATGYAAALVQLRRFAEAAAILRRVIALAPDEYAAHANLALALHELKDYARALPELEWCVAARPEVAATYFFIATAHDNLGQYQQALDAYEKFLSRADLTNNKLEIEKTNLRLPPLRDQIKRGQGAKKKRP